ncbi:MAG TPA: hemerythrin domain-containing protein [Dyella sp.]|nr:hemerythrin domain-containing protein [Dyella sp.]
MDITRLILDDHAEQRRRFALLEQIDPSNTDALSAVWQRLSVLLEVHALAEEKFFYPALLTLGKGAGEKPDAAAETDDAIGDHNDIRDAVAAVGKHRVGSSQWYDAVAAANRANSDHMGEEEREALTDFRRHATLELRQSLAVDFLTFEARHYAGVESTNKEPEQYIAAHE